MAKKQRGFTLIEILVVIIILAIASSVIVFNIGYSYLSNRNVDVFARELTGLIELAKNQSVFSYSVLALEISGKKINFVQLDPSQKIVWKPLSNQDVFWNARSIPEDLIVRLDVDKEQRIIFFPNGEITPFTITIHRLNSSIEYTIKGSYLGQIELSKIE